MGSGCRSAGDCLRALDQSGALGGDFVLVCGDVVSNMDLAAVVAEHRARRDTDPHAIMTMVGSWRTCSWVHAWGSLHWWGGAVELAPASPEKGREEGARQP